MFVTISAPVFPSEDPEKVEKAIRNIFPDAELEFADGTIEGEADLTYFSNLIRKQKILDVTRSVMTKGQRGRKTIININKQVAFVGKISYTEEKAVLGTIKVILEDENLEALIDMIAPNTVDGEEVRI